jgi:hypothetical protein
MARTEIPAYESGQIITAAHANAYWRDNELAHWARLDELANPVMAVVGKTASQSIPHNTVTTINWGLERLVDPASMHSNTVNNARLIAPVAGWYMMTLNCQFDLAASGFRWVAVRDKTGALLGIEDRDGTTNTSRYISIAGVIDLAEGDYIYVNAWQNSGGALNFVWASDQYPSFSLQFIRGA